MDVETVSHFFPTNSSIFLPSSNYPQYHQSLSNQSYHAIPANTLFNSHPI